jgi:hypothetical protein
VAGWQGWRSSWPGATWSPAPGRSSLPGLLGAGIGNLIFLGLNAWTGYGTFSLAVPNLPPAPHLDLAQFGWAIAIGAAAGAVGFGIRWLALFLRPHVERRLLLLTTVAGLIIAGLAIAFGEATGKPSSAVLFSGQTALPPLLENAASYTAGTLVLLVVCKGLAYSLSLSSFRGGPTFPGMFIGAAGGIALSHLAGLPMVAGAAMGIGAMTAAMLQLPLTAVLITTLFLGTDGIKVMPLVIVAVVVAFVVTKWLTGPSTAPQVPEPAEAAVPRKSAKPVLTCAQSRRGLPPSRHSRSAFSASSARSRSDPASSFPTDARRDVLTGEWACISTTAAVCSTIVSNTGT